MSSLFRLGLAALAATHASAATFHLNQAVFDADAPKFAVLESGSSCAGKSFTVQSSGQVAYSGKLGAWQNPDAWSTQGYCVARFDTLSKPGTYTVVVGANETVSGSFTVGPKALGEAAIPKLVGYFTSSRQSGQANNSGSRATAGDTKVEKEGAPGTTYDVHGGWHDATGDVSKYLSHLSYANYMNPQQTPLTVWALAFAAEKIPALLAAQAQTAKVRQEGLWGADFLVRMQDAEGYFYITVFDGWDTSKTKTICAFETDKGTRTNEYQAAWREGGGMAIAALAAVSRWNTAGDYPATRYLEVAEKGYAHLKGKTVGGACSYCDDGKENIIDDYAALMAATELYRTTQTASYLTDARARAQKLVGRLSPRGFFWSDDAQTRPFWHASDAGLPVVALTRYLEIDTAAGATIRPAIAQHIQYLLTVTNGAPNPFGVARQTWKSGSVTQDAFFVPHTNETGYWWQGENARLASLAAAAVYGGRVSVGHASLPSGVPDSVARFAAAQLDWVLGANPKGLSFFQGLGRNAAEGYYTKTNGHFTGGIVNGITSCDASRAGCTEGTGVDYRVAGEFPMNAPLYTIGPWLSWRWTEQWLPHSTWFLTALAARYDEVKALLPTGVSRGSRGVVARPQVRLEEDALAIELLEPSRSALGIDVVDARGRQVARGVLAAGEARVRVALDASVHGVLVVRVGETSLRLVR
jgi:hypothetical protein